MIISLAPFLKNSSRSLKLEQAMLIKHALSTKGYFYVKNYLNSVDLMPIAEQFFESDDKPSSYTLNRGYIPLAGESGSSALELKEAFSFGFEPAVDANSLSRPNNWPRNPAFKNACIAFFKDMVENSHALNRAISLSLSEDEDFLSKYCTKGQEISLCRLLKYHVALPSENTIGSSPHTDWGFLTLLKYHDQGLQVFRDNSWIDVPVITDTLLVNGGDYLSALTDGEYKSPLHRVVHPETKPRLSFIFFYYPNYNARIPFFRKESSASLNQSLSQETREPSESIGDFLEKKWQEVSR